jgi:membrane protease YdiL (CAAX protease family)
VGDERPSTSKTWFRCPYCGTWLDLRYYFCLHCGTPYRAADGPVYEESAPLVPSFEKRLATEGRSSFDTFCILAVGLVIFAGARIALGQDHLVLGILLQEGFLAGVTIIYAVLHRSEIYPLFGRIRWTWAIPLSLPILGGFLLLNKGYHDALTSLLDLKPEDDELAEIVKNLSWPAAVALICASPGFFEELAFRGVAQTNLTRAVGPWPGILVSSVLFVTLHFSVLSFPYLFVLSVFLGWVRDRTCSIYPSMVLHFLHNLGALALIYRGGP